MIDPDHAVPVMLSRNGLRGIAHGTGDPDELVVPNLPLSSDLKPGDQWVTSGLGGRFPAGFPVGTITALRHGPSGMFLEAVVKPAAELQRSGEVLLLRDQPDPVGPPAPAPEVGPPSSFAPAAAAGTPKPAPHGASAESRVPSPESRLLP